MVKMYYTKYCYFAFNSSQTQTEQSQTKKSQTHAISHINSHKRIQQNTTITESMQKQQKYINITYYIQYLAMLMNNPYVSNVRQNHIMNLTYFLHQPSLLISQ
eukprot:UN11937